MFNELRLPSRRHIADAAIIFSTTVWGIQFIVMKDAFDNMAPLAFNALRFSVGLPFMLALALRHRDAMHIDRRDVPRLIGLALMGQFGYQFFAVQGLQRTTSTNAALVVATIPTWTALLSIALGIVAVRRRLLLGVGLSLSGVLIVILGAAGARLGLSRGDLTGMGLTLCATMATSVFTITVKSLIQRYGGMPVAIWMYIVTWSALVVVASPDLAVLSPSDIPVAVVPNLLYAGLLSSALGFLIEGFALRELGAARVANYYNFAPVIAAVGGVVALSEPVTLPLVIGGSVTMIGVLLVRRNTYLVPQSHTAPEALAAPAAEIEPLAG